MTDIISKIKEIRNKPDEAKKRILWIMVFVCMVFVFAIWIFTFMHSEDKTGNLSDANILNYPDYDSMAKNLEDLEKEKNEAMKNVAFEVEKTEIAAIAVKYIGESGFFDGVGADDFMLIKEEKIDGIWKLEYKQSYKNIPVELSEIIISVNAGDKTVNVEKSVYFPGIDLDVSPKISEAEALESIRSEIDEENITAKKSQIVIYSIGESKKNTEHYLSWKMNVYDEKAFFEGIYFVDADNGKLLR